MDSDKQKPDTPKPPQIPIPRWTWWVILIALLLWNFLMIRPTRQPEATIAYSTFLQQVQAGNVASVKIVGAEITGEFIHPVTLPEPTPAPITSPAASPTPTASPLDTIQPIAFSAFRTTFPETVGDTNLMPLLEAHQVEIDVAQPSNGFWAILLSNGLPLLLLVGFMVLMARRTTQGQDGVLSFGRSKARKYVGDHPQVTFADVAGEDEAKNELQDIVDFLQQPAKYHQIGARIPRGLLLVGPPGTGKTLMARAVSGEAGVPFFSLSASEFVEMFVGVGASRVRDLFNQAKEAAPAIVFIDELDAVGRRRGAGLGTVNDEREQTLNQLLVEMDGFDDRHEVIIMAATNRPDVLDPALLRPGRFDRQVTLTLPDKRGRLGILRIHTHKLHLSSDVNLDILAQTTTGFSGADLANLCNEAALIAARHDESEINMERFEEALDNTLLGGVRPLLLDDHERRTVAYHEAGHALVAWLTPAADPVLKVTIIPRGRALGVTEQLPGEDRYNYNREYLLARLAVMMGGRAAEEVALGDVTTGAESDLVEATRLARRMVTRWAMGTLGPVAFQADEQQPFLGYELTQTRDYSEATAALVDQDMRDLLQERHQAAVDLLKKERQVLDQVVDRLLREETVEQKELKEILGPRPVSDAVPSDAPAVIVAEATEAGEAAS